MSVEARAFDPLVFESPDCIKVLDREARLLTMNESGRIALCIREFSEVEGTDWRTFWDGEERIAATRAVDQALSGGVGHFVGRYDVEGTERWWDVTVSRIAGDGLDQRLLVISRDITAARIASQIETRLQALVEMRLRMINEAGKLLSSSLDVDVILSSLAGITVDEFAAFCVIEVAGQPTIVRTRGGKPPAIFNELRRALQSNQLTALTRRTLGGMAHHLQRDTSRAWLTSVETSSAISDILSRLEIVALLSVPVVHDGVVSGALTLGIDLADSALGVGTQFASTDVLFAEELGRRAGSALANARSFGRERAIAVRMQQSALPATLPKIDRLQLTAAYRASSSESNIGGDWYDAFVLPDGRVAMSVGDVGGHGLGAALTMIKLRQAMRIATFSEPSVLTMLNVAEASLRMEGPESFATAIAAIYDPYAHTLEVAGAGHPGPYIRYPDGTIADLTGAEPLLGVGATYTRSENVALMPDCLVVFFTDGLIEFDRDVDRGLKRLEREILALSTVTGTDPAQDLLTAVVGSNVTPDDIALLVGAIDG